MFLTPSEIEQLTGYRVPARQITWLTRNAIPHFVNGAGRPVVTRAAVEARGSGRDVRAGRVLPNLAAVR